MRQRPFRRPARLARAIPLLVSLLLAGCGLFSPAADPLNGTSWVLVSLNGAPPLEGTHPTLRFADGYISGATGCNQFMGADEGGKYKTTRKGGLAIGNFMQSVMLCSTPEGVMEQETAYRGALVSAAAYRLAEDRLEIQNAAGQTTLVFIR